MTTSSTSLGVNPQDYANSPNVAVDENAEKGSGELSHGDKGEGNSKDRTVHEELTKRGTQKVPPIAQTVGT